jgi:hypothetical protein
MLELPRLLVGPWVPAPDERAQPETAATRAILDPAARARLGIVRERPRGWPRWLQRESLEVCETEDDSLLCTIRAPWLLAWATEIYDAEDRRVASVRGGEILDGLGRLVAVVQGDEAGTRGTFVARDGAKLADWQASGEEILLQFSELVAPQPFVKMALLGALLSRR